MWTVTLPPTRYFELGQLQTDAQAAAAFEIFYKEAAAQPAIAIDTETTGLVVWKDIPLYWSLAWPERRATLHANVLPLFQPLFAQTERRWVLANAKYDTHILANVGVQLAGDLADVAVMHALLFEDRPHGLKNIAKHLLGWTYGDFQTQFGKITKLNSPSNLIQRAEQENFQLLVEYAANDAWATWLVYEAMQLQLRDAFTYSLFNDKPPFIETLWDLFDKVEVPYTRVLWEQERVGIRVDRERLERVAPQAQQEIYDVEKEIAAAVGYVLNPRSPTQLVQYFIKEQKLRPIKWSKGGKGGVSNPSVDSMFLEAYAKKHPVAGLIQRHRDLTKLHGTYIVGLHELLDPDDRIHTRYNQDTVRTGRLSSSNPNCFHPATEVLTPNGWIALEQYQPGTLVAQWDNGIISFVTPLGYVKQPASELVHLKSQHVHLAVTKDHRCLLRHRQTGELQVFAGADYPEDWQQLHAGHFSGGGQTLTADFIRLLVAVQAGGHYHNNGIELDFQKPRNILRLQALLVRLAVPFALNTNYGRQRFRILAGDTVDCLKAILGPYIHFGAWLLQLCPEELQVFGDEVFLWRELWTNEGSYSSDSYIDAKWVQTVLALQGLRTHFRHFYGERGEGRFQVDTVRQDYSLTTNVEKTVIPYTGEVYCVTVPSSFLLVRYDDEIAVTGNCQNIPRPENDKWDLRSAFIPRDGNEMCAADYQQLEMRLLAAGAEEPQMLQIFKDGKDIHTGNVEMVFGIPYEDSLFAKHVEKLVKAGADASYLTDYIRECLRKRNDIKAVGFGLNYGMGAGKLSNTLGITREEAQALIDKYMNTYPAVKQFFQSAIEETEMTGFAFTILGRRRSVIEISNEAERHRGERIATNTVIQGSAADVCKMAQIKLHRAQTKKNFGYDMLLQVHDELVFEGPRETREEFLLVLRECMEHPFSVDLDVALDIDVGFGPSWGHAK